MLLLRIVLGLLAFALLLIVAGIAVNRPPLTSPPGLVARLKIYLGTHRAETAGDSVRSELRPRVYSLSPPQLYAVARAAVADLGWQLLAEDPAKSQLHAVVATRLWRFKDDFELLVEPAGTGSRLRLSAQSRVGRGDFGANTRHILDFYAALERRLAMLNPRR